jgi:hypothetical protein
MMFFILIVLMLAVLIGFGLYLRKGLRTVDAWKWLPREKNFGMVFLIFSLSYGAYYGRFMLEGGLSTYRPMVWILLPIVVLCCYFFLDFVFARALGGVLLVLSIELLGEGFIINLPHRALFSAVTIAYGVLGLFLIGMPWLFRDFLEKVNGSNRFRSQAIFFIGMSVVFFLLFLVFSIVG